MEIINLGKKYFVNSFYHLLISQGGITVHAQEKYKINGLSKLLHPSI